MDGKKKFFLSVKVLHITPAHITFVVYSGMQYSPTHTRGSAGNLTVGVDEAQPLFERLDPVCVSFSENVNINDIPEWMLQFRTYEELQGLSDHDLFNLFG